MGFRPANLKGFSDMGLTHVAATVKNYDATQEYTADFLVDTGAWVSMAPASALKKIGVEPIGSRTYELANGELVEYEFGPAQIWFLGELALTEILFGPENAEPILGVLALESAGFLVDPPNQRLRKMRANQRLRKMRARPLKLTRPKAVA
jgi:clan AA aspartic protease